MLFTKQGDMNCPPLRRMVMYFKKSQKDLGTKCCQTWRLKAQSRQPHHGSWQQAICTLPVPMPLKFSSEKHSALFQPVHFEKLTQLWMIHDESNTFSNHDWKQNGVADAMEGIKTIIPYLCKSWSISQLIKALVLAPWPTDTCAKSLFLPTNSGYCKYPLCKGTRNNSF